MMEALYYAAAMFLLVLAAAVLNVAPKLSRWLVSASLEKKALARSYLIECGDEPDAVAEYLGMFGD
jgi:hypothetical protein